jgi:hypothetical protein
MLIYNLPLPEGLVGTAKKSPSQKRDVIFPDNYIVHHCPSIISLSVRVCVCLYKYIYWNGEIRKEAVVAKFKVLYQLLQNISAEFLGLPRRNR